MKNILNYIKINELISTSGQPKIEEFDLIKDEGFEVVINLALCNASNAIENEDKVVTNLGMSYFHIPVDFENPKASDLKLFINVMQSLGANKVWVHCAKNYRVSAFMYVYHKYVLKTPFENIDLSIFNIWNPDKTWQELMKITLEDLYKA
ncbi:MULTISPECIES: protein tyrosine phosphatase family protein [Arcobacter]|uniref:Phosphatase (DUF442 domain) n=1 Tax=Arcobacter ellisii TaxID=913109 RepID=A0A347U7J6_9BACT|nr:protein tyrosine phosphatase family protein [Arcobacter ellisii]AXX94824.1 putative phosphatase (DUF442 domain) [Arcobacter ellisii]RXI30578.1 hypothetical protein CP962_07360 [Arcobacter ellisii]